MQLIFESKHFIVHAPETPQIDRLDGGHIVIDAKDPALSDRTQLDVSSATELMILSMLTGEAMTTVMRKKGIDIGRVNYHESGNWRPLLRNHVYGRARGAKIQPFGQSLHFVKPAEGFGYTHLTPLTEEDCRDINIEVNRLLNVDKYQKWKMYLCE